TDIGPTLPKGLAQCNLSFAEVTLRIPSLDPSNPSDTPPSEVTTPPLTMQPGAAESDVPITLPAPSRKNTRKYLSNGAGKPSPRRSHPAPARTALYVRRRFSPAFRTYVLQVPRAHLLTLRPDALR